MWLLLAFCSAALLGFYDVFKKKSLSNNAVLPVLALNTTFFEYYFYSVHPAVTLCTADVTRLYFLCTRFGRMGST